MPSVAVAPPALARSGRLLRTLSDERLVARVRAGDQGAFEVIYDRYHRDLLSFCRHMLGTREEAEDALQHTCISAYRAMLRDDRPLQLKAWLFAIARNRCLTVLRARREHADVDDVQPAVEGLASEVQRREDLREILADMQRLPEDQRAALVLSEIGAHTHEEIGVILDVRKEKVKALVFQAREQLIGARKARDTDCEVIREQLATLRGGALRRTELRRHVDQCPGCAAYKAEVQRQRAAIAVMLPVIPSAALKSSVLGAVFGGGAAGGGGLVATAAGGGAAAAAGAGAATGGGGMFAALGAQGLAVKALAVLAVAGGAGGTGYVAVEELRADPAPRPAAPAVEAATPAAAPATPVSRPVSGPASTSASPTAVTATGKAKGRARRGAGAPGRTKTTTAAGAKGTGGPSKTSAAPATPGAQRSNGAGKGSSGAKKGGPAKPAARSKPAKRQSAVKTGKRRSSAAQPKAPRRRAAPVTPPRSAQPAAPPGQTKKSSSDEAASTGAASGSSGKNDGRSADPGTP